jgi:hypothetical protein
MGADYEDDDEAKMPMNRCRMWGLGFKFQRHKEKETLEALNWGSG